MPRRDLTKAIARLEELYAQLPALECLGLCDDSCHTRIDASTAERERLLNNGVDLDAPTQQGWCPALTHTFGTGRCSAYDARPAICRLWGTADSMRCSHGCAPEGGFIPDSQAMRWMVTSLQLGGHHHYGPEVARAVELCLQDSHAAALLARFLRGDKSVAAELGTHLQGVSPQTPRP